MVVKNSLSPENLESLGARRLAELLIEMTARDIVAKRRLRLEISAAQGPRAAAGELRKRMSALARARKFVPRSRAAVLADDLEQLREAIDAHVSPRDPSLAADLLWRFMGLAEGVFDRCDDSYGLVGNVFRAARADLGLAASAARPNPVRLAGKVYDALWANGFGQYDGLIGELTPALGEVGLETLRKRVVALRDSRDRVDTDAPNFRDDAKDNDTKSNVVAGPWVGADGRVPDSEVVAGAHDPDKVSEYAIRQALADIADGQGDPDAYVAQHDEHSLGVPVIAAKIAQRLLAAGRAEEAWQFLEGAESRLSESPHAWDREWREARVDVLDALGRAEEAQAARWSTFETSLEPRYLQAYLERLSRSRRAAVKARALDVAASAPDVHRAIQALVELRAQARAAEVIVSRATELDGGFYQQLNHVCALLEDDYPLASTVIARAMIDDTLASRRSTRYRHAARNLMICVGLAARIADYRGLEDHETYLASLLEEHGRKKKFWGLVEETMSK